SSILCDLVSNLAAFVTQQDTLKRIIDQHELKPEVTIRILQDASVGILIAKRTALHNQFLRKAGQAREVVSEEIVEDMKRALRRLAREKAEAVARAEEVEQACRAKLR